MAAQSARSYLIIAAAIVIAGIFISASLFVAVGEAPRTSTSISTVESITTVTTYYPSTPGSSVVYSNITSGIQLSAIISPSTSGFGQNFTVVAIVRNVLTVSIQLNATGLDNPAYGPCQQAIATGINVYSGYYTRANISEASPLSLYNPSLIYTCPTESTTRYDFSPGNGVVETSVISGDWVGSAQNYTFNKYLPPGTYTVVVFDAWDQTAIGYIQVVPILAAES